MGASAGAGASAGVGLRRIEEREGLFLVCCLGVLCLPPKRDGRREKMLVLVLVLVLAGLLAGAVLVGW